MKTGLTEDRDPVSSTGSIASDPNGRKANIAGSARMEVGKSTSTERTSEQSRWPAIPSTKPSLHRGHPSRLPFGALRTALTGPSRDATAFLRRENGRLRCSTKNFLTSGSCSWKFSCVSAEPLEHIGRFQVFVMLSRAESMNNPAARAIPAAEPRRHRPASLR